MANQQNLRVLTSQEAREIGKKGGIASGIARRQSKTMRETLLMLLDTEYKKGVTYREAVNQGLLKGAINGNSNNYRTIVETLGELSVKEASNSNGVLSDLIEAMNNVKKS